MSVLIVNAELATNQLRDVLLEGGRVAWMSSPRDALSSDLSSLLDAASAQRISSDATVIDAKGGALLPGLHDHHIHLLSLAESLRSVSVGPQEVADVGELHLKLRSAGGKGWIRAVGYHESVAGDLTKDELDEIVRNRPLRIQHTSGAMWMLNTLGMKLLGVSEITPGAEVDTSGKATGRLFRNDAILRRGSLDNLSESGASTDLQRTKELDEVGNMLASFGVTGVTDATPGYGDAEVGFFRNMSDVGAIPQRLTLMPSVETSVETTLEASFARSTSVGKPKHRVSFGPHKIILSDHLLPDFSKLAEEVSC